MTHIFPDLVSKQLPNLSTLVNSLDPKLPSGSTTSTLTDKLILLFRGLINPGIRFIHIFINSVTTTTRTTILEIEENKELYR